MMSLTAFATLHDNNKVKGHVPSLLSLLHPCSRQRCSNVAGVDLLPSTVLLSSTPQHTVTARNILCQNSSECRQTNRAGTVRSPVSYWTTSISLTDNDLK